MDASNGVITLTNASSLDYETDSIYTLKFFVQEGDDNLRDTAEYSIILENEVEYSFAGLGDALQLDGSNDYLTTGFDIGKTAYPSLTVSGWFEYHKGSGSDNYLFSGFGASASDRGRGLLVKNSTGQVWIDGGFTHNSGYTLTDGEWYFLTTVFHSAGYKLYVNGELQLDKTDIDFTITGAQNLVLGRKGGQAVNYSEGRFDEFAVWGDELTAAQIANLYGKRVDTSSADLLLYYNFDQKDGELTVIDRSSNNNPATLNNMTGNEWGQARILSKA
ncbi:LamG domain-containing protein [bacterium SCSIO 12741]|nr:LamG domain-containing protein [bacterium SCSIO 12741]